MQKHVAAKVLRLIFASYVSCFVSGFPFFLTIPYFIFLLVFLGFMLGII